MTDATLPLTAAAARDRKQPHLLFHGHVVVSCVCSIALNVRAKKIYALGGGQVSFQTDQGARP